MQIRHSVKLITRADPDPQGAVLLVRFPDLLYLCVGLPYLVMELEAFANNKALDGALKQVKLIAPETPTIFFSGQLQ